MVHIQRLKYAFTETLHIYVYYDIKVLFTYWTWSSSGIRSTHVKTLCRYKGLLFLQVCALISCVEDGEEEFKGLFQFLYSVYWKPYTSTSPSECTEQLAHDFIYCLNKYRALITQGLLGMELTRQTQAWEASSCLPESSLGRKVRCNLKIRKREQTVATRSQSGTEKGDPGQEDWGEGKVRFKPYLEKQVWFKRGNVMGKEGLIKPPQVTNWFNTHMKPWVGKAVTMMSDVDGDAGWCDGCRSLRPTWCQHFSYNVPCNLHNTSRKRVILPKVFFFFLP